ncbi:MAG: dolichol kinase [Adhaeribacter sp.]|nr:dolichol kinase [Adhaeribacter sp.]
MGIIEDFLVKAIPSKAEILLLSPLIFIYVLLVAILVCYLKKYRSVKTPYTRKIFHFLIFTTAGIFQYRFGLSLVVLFGCIVSIFVLAAVLIGEGFVFYEALARETDRPYRTFFILVPLFTTALGGVLINIFFAKFSFIGYLVGGWGDAVGEPIGTRWGKHRYAVPSLMGVPAQRSLEGSAAVAVVSTAVAFAGLYLAGYSGPQAIATAVACGLGSAAVEAVSNHGLDNLTIQVAAAGIAYFSLI